MFSEPRSTPTPRPLVLPGEQLRAFWVDAFHPGFKSPQQVDQLIRDLQAGNFNAVFVQVRARGDAFFNKTIEPRSQELASRPGFDPLAYLLEKAHAANPRLEVHAWVNALNVANAASPPTSPPHLLAKHGPNAAGQELWLTSTSDGNLVSDGSYFVDPGNPAAARYTVQVISNLVRNYDVDGIHLDFIRYPGKDYGYNPASLARYQARTGTTARPDPGDEAWAQWRRDQVIALVRHVYLETIALKPRVKVSAALIAWGGPPATEGDWKRSSAYSDVMQDWPAWLKEGILDLAVPMDYDNDAVPAQKAWFDGWMEWDKDHVFGRHLVIGIGVFLNDLDASSSQVQRALNLSLSGLFPQGVSLFSYASPDTHAGSPSPLLQALSHPDTGRAAPFSAPSRIPDMPWKSAPSTGYLKGTVLHTNGLGAEEVTVSLAPAPAAVQTVGAAAVDRTLSVSGSGFYGAVSLPPGVFTVNLRQAGQTLAVSTVTIRPGLVSNLDFKLP